MTIRIIRTASLGLPVGTFRTLATGIEAALVADKEAVYDTPPLDVSGPVTADAAGNLFSDGQQIQASVSGAGKQSGIAASAVALLGAWGQMPNGKYLTSDFFPGAGRGRSSLALYTGDLAAEYNVANVQSLTSTRAGDSGVLKKPDGTNIAFGAAYIYCAWPASNGDIFFVAVETGNFYHLYRCKAGTYTVGAGGAVTDGKAVLSLGMIGAVQTDQNRIFTQRNFCEAKVNGVTHYYIGEYSVATGRVDGGAKDAVKVHRSIDGGTTWATFLEWNTNGTHQVDHVHAIRQDPYTGWIYILTGDAGSENMVISYNGTAAPVAENATAATIAATPGYKVLAGTELARYTDLCFSVDHIYSIPDADTDVFDAASVAYVATRLPRALDHVVSVTPVDRVDNVPPAIAVQSPVHGDFFLSFCASIAYAGYPFLDVFQADYAGGGWTRIAKLSCRAGMVARAFFMDNQGRLWIHCDASTWLATEADYDGTSKTRSLVLTPGPRTDAPFVSVR